MSGSAGGEEGSGWLERFASRAEEREALVWGDQSTCYAELAETANETARALSSLGLVSGDLVAVLATPSAEGVATLHALFEKRIVMLPLNARLSEREQRDALAATRPVCLIVSPDVDGGLASRLASSVGCGLLLLRAHDDASRLAPQLRLGRPLASSDVSLSTRRGQLARAGAALVLHTSGTSGAPKGVVLSLGNLIASAKASTRLLGHDSGDRWLLCMPLFHIGGLSILIRSALSGTSVLLHERFEAVRVAEAVDAGRVSRVSLVATMLARVLEARGNRPAPEQLSLVLLGGGPASQSLLERAVSLGYPIAPTYGLTEAASQVATRPPRASPPDRTDLSAGLRPLPGVEIRIVDSEGKICAADAAGEIEVRGPIVMQGYLEDPAATAATLRDGWLATGDIGRIDRDGGLRVLDRRADLIVSGGENVYPAEVEAVLVSHEAVQDAGVIGRSDSEFGARPTAFIVAAPGAPIVRSVLDTYCRGRLAAYKVPVEFTEVESLPRTASGKLQRRALVAIAAEDPIDSVGPT